MRFVFRVRLGVAHGKFGDFGQGFRAILPHEKMAAVREGREERGILGVDEVAEAGEFESRTTFSCMRLER